MVLSIQSTYYVIDYCFDFIKGYFEGIIGNLELMPIYYPGWVMRVYYDLEDEDPISKVKYLVAPNNKLSSKIHKPFHIFVNFV